ncbi:MAG: hypothetical protein ACTS4X_00510 [Candidatus Hodgkinia cicadicola]
MHKQLRSTKSLTSDDYKNLIISEVSSEVEERTKTPNERFGNEHWFKT